MNSKTIDEVFSHTHLGLILTSNLSWKSYILDIHILGFQQCKHFNIHSVQGWQIYPNNIIQKYSKALYGIC